MYLAFAMILSYIEVLIPSAHDSHSRVLELGLANLAIISDFMVIWF